MEKEFNRKISGNATIDKAFDIVGPVMVAVSGLMIAVAGPIGVIAVLFEFVMIIGIKTVTVPMYEGMMDVPGLRISCKKCDWRINGVPLKLEAVKKKDIPSKASQYLEKNALASRASCVLNGNHTLTIWGNRSYIFVIFIDDVVIMSDNYIHEDRIYVALGGYPPQQNMNGNYGYPQQGMNGGYGYPQQGMNGGYGMPQQGMNGGYGYPQQGMNGGYGYPQQGMNGNYGYPQQDMNGNYGAPQATEQKNGYPPQQ